MFKDWLKDIGKEILDSRLRPYLIKWGWLKPKPLPENIVNIIIVDQRKIKKDYEKDIRPVKTIVEADFIEIKDKELTTKNQKVKLNALNSEFKDFYNIALTNYVYPTVYDLLYTDQMKTGFQLYFAYKNLLKNKKNAKFVEDGLRRLQKEYKQIKEWFEYFKILDISGYFNVLILPLSKKILDDDVAETRKQFCDFIKAVVDRKTMQKEMKPTISIGKLKIGIIYIGTMHKKLANYYIYLGKLKQLSCNLIIMASGGIWTDKWMNTVNDVSKIAQKLFNFKEERIVSHAYANIEDLIRKKKGTKLLYIFLDQPFAKI